MLTGEISIKEFEFSEEEVTLKSPIQADIRLQKLGTHLLAEGQVNVLAEMTCGRCVERYQSPLQGSMFIQYVPASELKSDRDAGVAEAEALVSYDGKIVDLLDDVRQTVVLSVPIKKICRPDCRGLCPTCGKNLNRGGVENTPYAQRSGGPLPQVGGCDCHGSSQ